MHVCKTLTARFLLLLLLWRLLLLLTAHVHAAQRHHDRVKAQLPVGAMHHLVRSLLVVAIARVPAILTTLVEVGRKALLAHQVVQILILSRHGAGATALVLLQVGRMLSKAGRQRMRRVVVAKVCGRGR